jgi:hypothetical protein
MLKAFPFSPFSLLSQTLKNMNKTNRIMQHFAPKTSYKSMTHIKKKWQREKSQVIWNRNVILLNEKRTNDKSEMKMQLQTRNVKMSFSKASSLRGRFSERECCVQMCFGKYLKELLKSLTQTHESFLTINQTNNKGRRKTTNGSSCSKRKRLKA